MIVSPLRTAFLADAPEAVILAVGCQLRRAKVNGEQEDAERPRSQRWA